MHTFPSAFLVAYILDVSLLCQEQFCGHSEIIIAILIVRRIDGSDNSKPGAPIDKGMGFLLLPVIGSYPKPAKLTLKCTEQHLAHTFSLFFLSNFFSIAFYILVFVSIRLGLASPLLHLSSKQWLQIFPLSN